MFRVLAIVGLVALAACSGDLPAGGVPAQSTTPSFSPPPSAEVETPNSMPNGATTQNPMALESGVVGVTHLPP